MQVLIADKLKILADQACHQTRVKIAASFSKFGYNVSSVELTTEGVDGPREGVEKECRVLVKLKKMENVVAITRDESLAKAISRCIHRAERAVAQKIQRRLTGDCCRRSDFVINFYNR